MKILITNDDGIEAKQLIPLIKACRQYGEVTVVVPKFEQSAKSHGIEIRKAFEITQVKLTPEITVWSVDSTPADCVRFAVSGLKMHFDLVISGINRGYNLGKDTMYSGTLAAATEAVTKGMKALAISSSMKYYDQAVTHLDDILQYVERNNLWNHNALYNINIPVSPKGFRITRLGAASFSEEFIPMEDNLYYPGGHPLRTDGSNFDLDTDATACGYISVTPMTVDRTNTSVFSVLEKFNS